MRQGRMRVAEGAGQKLSWNSAEFRVSYSSLASQLSIGGVYVRLLLDGVDQVTYTWNCLPEFSWEKRLMWAGLSWRAIFWMMNLNWLKKPRYSMMSTAFCTMAACKTSEFSHYLGRDQLPCSCSASIKCSGLSCAVLRQSSLPRAVAWATTPVKS